MAYCDTLRTIFLERKKDYSEAFCLRIHRTLSWLKRAEVAEDDDTKFITLWIAFNAAYAKESENNLRPTDQSSFIEFLDKINNLDQDKTIYNLVWKTYAGCIRLLMDNRYTFQPFWNYHNGFIPQDEWESDFSKANKKALNALSAQDTHAVLILIFQRLYTLRNQILHGGATFASSVNRKQLGDACNILATLIPSMVQIMLDNHAQVDWGKPFYPLITNS